jgi:hypothetical protein
VLLTLFLDQKSNKLAPFCSSNNFIGQPMAFNWLQGIGNPVRKQGAFPWCCLQKKKDLSLFGFISPGLRWGLSFLEKGADRRKVKKAIEFVGIG